MDARRKGEERVIPLLRTIAESTNGPSALTLPILRAVADCMKPAWVEKGLALIEAYDAIDLVALRSTLVDLGLEDQLGRVLHRQLTGILGPHMVAQPVPKPKRVRKAMTKPDGVSQEVWDAIMAQRRERRLETGPRMLRQAQGARRQES